MKYQDNDFDEIDDLKEIKDMFINIVKEYIK